MRTSWLLIILSLALGCEKETALSQGNRGQLLESSNRGHLSKSEIVERVTELSAQDFADHDVTYYSITYRTEYQGKPIDTKGLLIIPDGTDSADLIIYCHGTEIP